MKRKLVDLARKMAVESRRRKTWFDRVEDKELREELLALRKAFAAKELGECSIADCYRAATQAFGKRIPIGVQGFSKWLMQKD